MSVSPQAIYRRWRPRRFGDVVGQDHVTRTLRNAVKTGRVAHGYLFCGPRGVAKTSTARILAKAINCLDPQGGEPCDKCELCRAIADGTCYDVLEMDAASNGLVDNVRELRQNVLTHPDQARRKVYILDEAHRMSGPAFDALLKTLEEPPEHAVFILVTSEPDKVPATIVSRCQRFDFRRLPQRGIVSRLREICEKEGVEFEPQALDAIARAATGSMRDAQSLLDQLFALGADKVTLADVESVLGTAGLSAARTLAAHVIRREQAEGLRLISQVVADGADPRQFCRDVADYLRGLLLLKLGGPDEALDLSAETLAEMGSLAQEATVEQLLNATRLFGQADAGWRGTLHFQLPLELAFVDATLDRAREAPTPVAPVGSPASAPPSPRRPMPTAPPPRPAPAASSPASTPAGRWAPNTPEPARASSSDASDASKTQPPPVEAPSAPATTASAPVSTPGELVERWQAVRGAVAASNPRLAGFLNDVKPASLEGTSLVLHARSDAHAQQVKKHASVFYPEIQRAYGGDVTIRVTVPERWEPLPDDPLADPLVRVAAERGWRARPVE